ncbi:MAG: Mov34/MPN/PAD-1 family protein [Deltaproteobacteria bacterium]|jgi:proteasome lid subunit RPN8/RPN11/sulfur carrier protein ThiS|nr:Mov34/MPN/PAD-1 family protein [Deltaproteobacteria bacterium]
MKIQVRLSTTLRNFVDNYIPSEGLEVTLNEPLTLEEVALKLGLPTEEIKIVMLNGRRVKLDAKIGDGDRVGFFPAVGGGNPNSALTASLAPEVLKALASQGEKIYPAEACGFLLGLNSQSSLSELKLFIKEILPSISRPSRLDSYLLEAQELEAAEVLAQSRGLVVAGFYHSHPDSPAQPSPLDHQNALDEYLYAIVEVRHGKCGQIRLFRWSDEKFKLTSLNPGLEV